MVTFVSLNVRIFTSKFPHVNIGANAPCIQVPTTAATDAPTARISGIYVREGAFPKSLKGSDPLFNPFMNIR